MLVGLFAACGDTVPDAGVLCFIQDNPEDGTQLVTCDNGADFVIADGRVGRPGTGCRTQDNSEDGTVDMVCDNGLRFTVFDGRDGSSCRVEENVRGEVVIRCDDGSQGVVSDGISCTTTTDAEAGSVTISCEDGTTATVFNGDDAEPCTVERDEELGTVTVQCGDGEGVLVDGEDGDTCRVEEDAETLDVSIVCGEGDTETTEVVIRGSTRVATLTGLATLLGEQVHDGILVEAVDVPGVSTTTAADGSYTLPRVPVGVRSVRFSFEGFGATVVDNIPVLPGVVILDPVELHRSEVVAKGTRNVILDLCGDGSTVVLLLDAIAQPFSIDGEPIFVGRLAIWDGGDTAPTVIAENATSFALDEFGNTNHCPGGDSVAFLSDVDFTRETATLSFWTRDGGITRSFEFDESTFYAFFPAEEADVYVLIEFGEGVGGTLFVYDAADDDLALVEEGFALSDFELAPDGSALVYESGEALILYRVADGTSFRLGSDATTVNNLQWSDNFEILTYVESDGELDRLRIFDTARGTVRSIAEEPAGAFASNVELSPNLNWVVYGRNFDGSTFELALYDVAGDSSVDLVGGRVSEVLASFDEGSTRLAYWEYTAGGTFFPLRARTLAGGATVLLDDGGFAQSEVWSPNGMFLAWWYQDTSSTQVYSFASASSAFVDTQLSLWAPSSASFIGSDGQLYLMSNFAQDFDAPVALDPDGFGLWTWEYNADGSRVAATTFAGVRLFDGRTGAELLAADLEGPELYVVGNSFLLLTYYEDLTEHDRADLYGILAGSTELLLLETGLMEMPLDEEDLFVDGSSIAFQTAHATYPEYLSDAARFMRLP